MAIQNRGKLEFVLTQIKDDVLEPYMRSIWENPSRLEELVRQFRSQSGG